jgi:peptide/nickel transport system substrate-binding protein
MHMFDHLVAHDPTNMKVVPSLAESWRTIDDQTWEFRIRKGVKFHNGEPLNADAVKFSVERVLNPAQKSFLRDRFKSITEIQIIDEFGIRLKTARPDPVLLERLTTSPFCRRST